MAKELALRDSFVRGLATAFDHDSRLQKAGSAAASAGPRSAAVERVRADVLLIGPDHGSVNHTGSPKVTEVLHLQGEETVRGTVYSLNRFSRDLGASGDEADDCDLGAAVWEALLDELAADIPGAWTTCSTSAMPSASRATRRRTRSWTARDFAGSRDNPHNFLNRAAIDDAYDYNRDSFVDGTDLALARDNNTNFLTALRLLNLVGERCWRGGGERCGGVLGQTAEAEWLVGELVPRAGSALPISKAASPQNAGMVPGGGRQYPPQADPPPKQSGSDGDNVDEDADDNGPWAAWESLLDEMAADVAGVWHSRFQR